MKITFLLTWADGMGGTEHAAITQAKHLAGRHDVRIISTFHTADVPFFAPDPRVRVDYLIDARGTIQEPTRSTDLSPSECASLASQPSELIERSWEPSFNRLSDGEMRLMLGSLDADIIVVTTPALMAAAVRLVPPAIVIVGEEHRTSQFRGATGEPLMRYAPYLDALVALTDRTCDWMAESLGAVAPRLEAIPNAIPEGFRPRSSLTNHTIVMAARLVPEKGVDHAIQAFALVAEKHPTWSMRVFGSGPELNKLKRLAESTGLHDRVLFAGTTTQMPLEWAKAGLMVLSSKGEAMPLGLLEAMSAGVPAVSYDVATGPAEVIRHGVDGLLVPAGDVDALADALDRIMTDENLRIEFGAAALERAKEFSADRIAAIWEKLFAELIDERNNPRREIERADRIARQAIVGAGHFHPTAPAERVSGWRDQQHELEHELERRRPELVRSGGRLAEVRNSTLEHEIRQENLVFVADSLEGAGIEFVVVPPGTGQVRLIVASEDRDDVLSALAASGAGTPVYAELLLPRLQAPGTVLAEVLVRGIDVKGLRLFRSVVTEGRTLRYGPGQACDVEFWSLDPETGERFAPMKPTSIGARLTSLKPSERLEIGSRSFSTVPEAMVTAVDATDFPVDAVWTWVDDADPAWQSRLDDARRQAGMAVVDRGDHEARFRNHDELKYSLRSVAMYAPWIRHHYIVTDDQTPAWLDSSNPDVTVVSHREIFKDPSALPTFNSHAIGSQLHRIPGLAEQFLVFNDDVFLGRQLSKADFFLGNGMAKTFRSPTRIPLTPVAPGDGDYLAARKNNRGLIEEAFGRTLTNGYLHAPHAMVKTVLDEIEERFALQWDSTMRAKFRGPDDIAVLSSLHHEFGYLTNRVVPGSIRSLYVNIASNEQQAKLTRLLTQRNVDVFCLNDSADSDMDASERGRVLRAFLEAYFPVASPFEK